MDRTLQVGDAVVFSDDYLTALTTDAERTIMKTWTGTVTECTPWTDEDSVEHSALMAVVTWIHPVPTELPVEDGVTMQAKDYVPATEQSGWPVTALRTA